MKKKSAGKSGEDKRSPKSPGNAASQDRRSGQSPSVRQRKYVGERLKGKGPKQAALAAGYSEPMAKNATQKIERKAGVRELLIEAFKDAGITPQLLAQTARNGLHASVVVRKTQYAKREVLVDFKERREMLRLIGQFEGSLIEKHEVDAGPTLAELLEESFHA